MGTDDCRIDRFQRIIVETNFCRHITPQVIRHDMRILDQLVQDFDTLGGAEIQGQRTFVEIETLEIEALLLAQPVRSDVPRRVAALGRFDLDDVGAELGEEHRTIRTCTILLCR